MKKSSATKRRYTRMEGMTRRDAQVALKIARAQLRAIRQYAAPHLAVEAEDGQPRFIQITTVTRGYSGVTQALDNAGQVWERVSLMEDVIDEDGKKGKRLKDSWWVPLSMQRREA